MMIKMNGVVEEDGCDVTNVSVLDEELPDLDGAADLSDDEDDDGESDESDEDEDPDDQDVDQSDSESPRLASLLAEIAEAEMLCANAEEAVNEAKAVLKEAKAEYDGCVIKLRKLAKAVRNDEDRPLFDGLNDGGDDDSGQPLTADEEDEGRYTALLATSIDILRLPAGVVSKLAEEHVGTIGQLEQLREDITLGRKEWPRGIGPAKVDLIETVVTEWIADNYTDGTAEPDTDDDNDEGDEE